MDIEQTNGASTSRKRSGRLLSLSCRIRTSAGLPSFRSCGRTRALTRARPRSQPPVGDVPRAPSRQRGRARVVVGRVEPSRSRVHALCGREIEVGRLDERDGRPLRWHHAADKSRDEPRGTWLGTRPAGPRLRACAARGALPRKPCERESGASNSHLVGHIFVSTLKSPTSRRNMWL